MATPAVAPVLPFARRVFVRGVALTAGTGVGLVALPGRTGDFWAWGIKAPLSAAFFGAAAVALALAARTEEWRRARPVAIAALSLTSLALLATALHPGPFAFGGGGYAATVVALLLLVALATTFEERRLREAPA